jgi:L-Ala-D/L-Glu epimerase
MATPGGGLRVEFELLELHTTDPFNIARLDAPSARYSAWVRVLDDHGVEGWGEAVAIPYYGDTAATIQAVLPRLAEVVASASEGDPLALERIETAVATSVGRNGGARAGISAALHDLVGKRLGVPVWRLWGLSPRAPNSSFTLGIAEPEVLRRKVREATAYPVLKLKVGTPRDEEMLCVVREEAPDKTIRVDANTAWTAKEAIAALPMLVDFGIELIEQPVAPGDIDGLRLLRRRSSIPIIADESCVTLGDIPRLAGAVDGVNLKLAKCGGLREAMRMIHTARAHGMQVMLGCMVESTLGIAAAVQLAPLVDYLDIDGAALLAADPFRGPGLEADGSVRFNLQAGLGVERSTLP